ncbi:FAD-dependent monooxygenase [Bacteriovoracaceae bacterium]|nr:FAD-dependent monooxygenase [Bacteriovoracaceae bacterium]
MKQAVVIGAGLVGCLQSLFLKQKGFKVKLVEARDDCRKIKKGQGRSINLVLTHRGIQAAKKLGIEKQLLNITVPVSGREVHLEKETYFQPYGTRGEQNYSISRLELNQTLLNLCEHEDIELNFEQPAKFINFETKTVDTDKMSFKYDLLFGCDGVNSEVRNSLMKISDGTDSISDLGVGYQEFLLPAGANEEFLLKKDALHIWPHGKHFVMALPNLDGSFTMTLYVHQTGIVSFDKLKTEKDYTEYFDKYYSDLPGLCPDFANQLVQNPVGNLGTLKSAPWHYKDEVCLVGDAAHAITPFFGQGMNLGFEDCALLNSLFFNEDKSIYDFESFFNYQKPNADAIAAMAEENYIEMSDKVGDESFILRKKIDQELERRFPNKYHSRYSMVMYTCEPYVKCLQLGVENQKLIERIVRSTESFDQINWVKIESEIS